MGIGLDSLIDIFDSDAQEAKRNFSSIFNVYKDFAVKLASNVDLLGEIASFAKLSGEFDVYEDAELNDFLFALDQTIQGIMLKDSNLGNSPDPDSFYKIFKAFMQSLKKLQQNL